MKENSLLIKLVVATETIFFASLLMAFVYFSLAPGFRQQQLAALDLRSTGGFTVLLFASSFTYMRAEASYRQGAPGRLKGWLLATIGLGALFLLGQAREFRGLFARHVDIASNTFGTSFFTLTGFHGLHMLAGLVVLSILVGRAFAGDFNQPNLSVLSAVGIYWHFVDIVWAVVFSVVYVLPHFTHFGS
ncbi:heme-copper oxidase subunit III [Hymenobacter sp. BRD67]|nr:heme-copper oxidase subunit III [Hymenobacter sp. BRD67]